MELTPLASASSTSGVRPCLAELMSCTQQAQFASASSGVCLPASSRCSGLAQSQEVSPGLPSWIPNIAGARDAPWPRIAEPGGIEHQLCSAVTCHCTAVTPSGFCVSRRAPCRRATWREDWECAGSGVIPWPSSCRLAMLSDATKDS